MVTETRTEAGTRTRTSTGMGKDAGMGNRTGAGMGTRKQIRVDKRGRLRSFQVVIEMGRKIRDGGDAKE